MSSSVNSSSTPLAANTSFTGAWEFLSSEKHGVQAICSTDAAGTLLIEFSQNKTDINYTHTFAIEVDISFARSVKKKGNYYRTILNNGPNPQTTLQLVSIIETDFEPDTLDVTLDAATSSITMFGTDDTGTKRAVKTSSTGELVISGGGGGGGDASSANQIASNLALCARLDTIDLTLSTTVMSVEIDNQITGFATSQLQETSNIAQWTKLNLIAETNEDLLLSVDGISAKLNPLQIQSAQYTIEAVPSFAPDTVPAFTFPPSGIAKDEGWYFKNTGSSQPSQLFFYSYLNPAMAVAGRQFAYQLNDITMSYCVVRLIAVNSAEGLTTLGIYTRPTGSGDTVPGFFKSRKVYNIPTSAKLTQGMEVMLYWGVEPSLKLHPDVSRIQLQLATTVGPALGTEQLAFLSLNTDSAALAGNAEYIVSAAGFQYGAELIMDTQFTGESSASVAGSDASAANQVLQLNAATNSNLALYTQLTTIKEVLENQINVVNYGLFDNTPTYVPMSVNAGGELLTFDSACNVSIQQCFTQLETVNASLDAVKDGTSQFYVKIDGADDAIQIWGYNPVDAMPEAIYTTDHAVQAYIMNTDIPISGTVGLSEGAQVNLVNSTVGLETGTSVAITGDVAVTGTFWPETQVISGSIGLIENTVVGIAGSSVIGITGDVSVISGATALSVTETAPITSVFAKLQDGSENNISSTASEANGNVLNTRLFAYDLANDVTREVRMGESHGLFIENITEVDFEVVAKNDVKVINATGTSLDVHCFGSSDGTTFHHLKTTATGELVTHSQTRDGSGTAITSTPNGGITALDVAISGTPVISGEVSTKAQDTYAPQVLASGTVVGPAQIGTTADSQGFLWVAALLTFTSVTTGGQLYIEISPDGTNWARPSAGSVFVMSSVGNVSASILLGVPVAMRYVRLYADSPFSALGTSAWFSMK